MGKFDKTIDILFDRLISEVRESEHKKTEITNFYLKLNDTRAALTEANDTIKRLKDEIVKAGIEISAVRVQRDKYSASHDAFVAASLNIPKLEAERDSLKATIDRNKFNSGKYRYLCEVVRTLDIALGCAKPRIKLNRDVSGELDKLFLAAEDARAALDQG